MFFRKRSAERQAKEAEIQEIRQETLKKIDRATKATKKVNDLLEDNSSITLNIFYATGGNRRRKQT